MKYDKQRQAYVYQWKLCNTQSNTANYFLLLTSADTLSAKVNNKNN
jgi:hypothetical protein